MKELDLFADLKRVAAPPDFESGVLAELPGRRKQLFRLRRRRQLSFAGAAAVFLATSVLVNVLILQKQAALSTADYEKRPGLLQTEAIPVMETLDYSFEVGNASFEPRTIYILEQVSEASSSEITY